MEEINAIASAPSSSHVFKLDSFDDLTDTLVEQLVHYACTADEGLFIQLWTISVLVIIFYHGSSPAQRKFYSGSMNQHDSLWPKQY